MNHTTDDTINDTTARITVGSVVILIDERPSGLHVHHGSNPYDNSMQFVFALHTIPGVKEVNGPLINGIYAITCEIDFNQPMKAHVDRLTRQIRRVWTSFAG